MRGAPEPALAIMGGLQADDSFVPARVMGESDVFDLEIGLPGFPFRSPGEVRFIELLPKF